MSYIAKEYTVNNIYTFLVELENNGKFKQQKVELVFPEIEINKQTVDTMIESFAKGLAVLSDFKIRIDKAKQLSIEKIIKWENGNN